MASPANAVQAAGQGVVTADQLNTFVQVAQTFAGLRNFAALTDMAILCLGGSTESDGGQGWFWYNSSSTATDDNYSVIVPTGNLQGAWLRLPFSIGAASITRFTQNGAYTPKTGLLYAIVEAVGGGGGGAGCPTTGGIGYGGGGGSGGCYGRIAIPGAVLASAGSVAVQVGFGGAGGAVGSGSGTTGGNGLVSSFGSYLSVNGGAGGVAEVGGAPQQPTVNPGSVFVAGGGGGPGVNNTITTVTAFGGFGGGTQYAAPTYPVVANSGQAATGTTAFSPGAGGAGGVICGATSGAQGGPGASGVVIVTEVYL